MASEVLNNLSSMMAAISSAVSASMTNMGQPKWMVLSDSVDSKEALLANLDRAELNRVYERGMREPGAENLYDVVAAKTQIDYVGSVARDYFHMRRSRLSRLACSAAVAGGRGGTNGVFNGLVIPFVDLMLKKKR